jgi:glycerophosphoryl diester phosphodiesterase
MTLEELRELDLGTWFGEEYAGERIATLDEVLSAAKGRIRLNIEVKTHGHEKALARSVVEAIHRAGFSGDCVITSNDPKALEQVRELDPELTIGIIVAAKVGRLHKLDVDFYSVQPKYATVAFIRDAHAEEKDVHVWTVNDPVLMTALVDRGVDSIITDRPDLLIALIDERSDADELAAAVVRLFRR